MILAHIAGIPVQESLAYVAPAAVVVGWIYWAGRRERRRREAAGEDLDAPLTAMADDPEDDDLLGPQPLAGAGEHRRALH